MSEYEGPYAAAAWQYRKAGWQGVLPIGWRPAQKDPPPASFTGYAGIDPSNADIQAWILGREGAYNIGLRIPQGRYVLDVDDRHGGAATLAAILKRLKVELPKTKTCTARGEGQPSRHHYFRATLPEGRVWKDHPGGKGNGLDSLHVGQRYAVTWPSVNPETGTVYEWYDEEGELYEGVFGPDDFAELPAELIEEFSQPGEPMAGTAASDTETTDIIKAFPVGEPCPRVTKTLNKELDRISRAASASLHDPGALFPLVAYGIEGHAGVREALSIHQAAYVAARVAHRRQQDTAAGADWWRQVRGAVGKKLANDDGKRCRCGQEEQTMPDDIEETEVIPGSGTLPTLPEEFWAARPYLQQVREVAHGWCVSADVTLYALLARLSGMVPHTARVHTGIKGKKGASLNLFVAVYDDSGAGKSSSVGVADDTLMSYPTRGGFIDGVSIGSGQGIAELFMDEVEIEEEQEPDPETGKKKRPKKKMIRMQVRHNAYIYVDEGQSLTAQMEAKGSVLGATLRTAATGGTLGQANATKDRYRHIPGGSYSLGMVVGFQRSTVGPLLADATAGTPQRFLWASAADPSIPLDAPLADHMLMWDPTALGRGLTLAPSIRARMRAEAIERATGRQVVESLNAHKPIMMAKVAGLLTVLDKRTEVDESDWALAETVWDTSCAVRTAVIASLTSASREEAQVRTQARIREAVATTRALNDEHSDQLDRVARKIAKAVHDSGKTKRKEIRTNYLSNKDRPLFEEALTLALDNGWIEPSDIDGHDYKAGSCRPA